MWWRAGGRIPDQLEDEEFWKPTDKDQKIEKLTGPPDGTFYSNEYIDEDLLLCGQLMSAHWRE